MSIYQPTDHSPHVWRTKAKKAKLKTRVVVDNNHSTELAHATIDSALTGWASHRMEQVYEACAVLAETNGLTDMAWPLMQDPDTGWVIPVAHWQWVDGKRGRAVMINHPKTHSYPVKWWTPSTHRNPAIRLERDRAKGYHWGVVRVPAVVLSYQPGQPGPVTVPKMGASCAILQLVAPRYQET